MWSSIIVTRMFSVQSAPVNLQRMFWNTWKSSLHWTNRRNRRVTILGMIFLRLQSIVTLMKIQCRSSPTWHNILSTNWIPSLGTSISSTTSLSLSASFATSYMHALNSQKERWCILNKPSDTRIGRRLPSRYCERTRGRICFSIQCSI